MMSRATVILLLVALATPAALAAPEPTTVRVFHIQHCSIAEAAAAVEELLTEDGSFTVQPSKSRITVQDRPEVIDRVARVIAELDRTPDNYVLEFVLLEGTQDDIPLAQQATVDQRVMGMFPYTAYRTIGTTTINGLAGESARASLGEGYRVSFHAASTNARRATPYGVRYPEGSIQLQSLALEKMSDGPAGDQRSAEVLRASVILSQGQDVIIGAGTSEDASRGLVLTLHAQSIGGQ
jgi:hypothetical protein